MRPITTLFMLTSLDGKISTGDGDLFDFDHDLPQITGTRSGLHQYYDAEQETDLWSFNTGVVMRKIGVNTNPSKPSKSAVSFVLVDNKPHLEASGVEYLCNWLKQVVICTTNPNHPAYSVKRDNLTVLPRAEKDDFSILFDELYTKFNIQRLTLQSGSTMNRTLLEQGLIDYVDLFIAPILIGGKTTPSLIGGPSLTALSELNTLRTLDLLDLEKLENSYIRLKYRVVNSR